MNEYSCDYVYIDPKIARLFAAWFARKALALAGNPDPRSVAACDLAERHIHGQTTDDELRAASDTARAAAWDTYRLR